jgi:CHAT domain-containing protein/tetratricopeptide (TPR) repeat protein
LDSDLEYDRIITHGDFDGVVSGAICSFVLGCDSFIFAGPSTITRAEISIGPRDVVCDLPYPLECGLWFDHHPGSREALALRGIDPAGIPGRLDETKPSAARVVLEYFSSRGEELPGRFAETVSEADTIDSFDYRSVEEWRRETPGKLVDMSLKAWLPSPRDRTKYLDRLARLVRDGSLEEVLADAPVAAQIARYREEEKRMIEFLRKSIGFLDQDTAHELVILDFTAHSRPPHVLKNLAYLIEPGALGALTVSPLFRGERKTNDLSLSMSLSMNMTGKEHGKDIGEIMRTLNIGDGHAGAAAGTIRSESKDEMTRKKKKALSDIWRLWKSSLKIIGVACMLACAGSEARSAQPPVDKRLQAYDAGSALLDSGENEKAARFFERSLAQSGGLVELADGLIEARSRLCMPNAAIAMCARALEQGPDTTREILGLFLSGERARLLRDFAEAAAYYRSASEAARRDGDTLSSVFCVRALVLCLLASQDSRGALESAQTLSALSASVSSSERLLACFMSLDAECLNAADRIPAADSLYRAALSKASARGFRQIESGCLAGLGRLEDKRQRDREAFSFYERSLSLERQMGSKEDIASLLNNLGQIEVRMGSLEAGEAHFAESEETAKGCGLTWILGYIYYGRGALAEAKGDKEGALKLFQQSLALHRKQGNTWGALGAELRLGYLRGSRGEYPSAVRHYERALAIYEEKKNLYGLSWTLAGLAVTYHKLGDFKKAEDYYRRTIEARRELGDKRGAAWALNSLGSIADMQGRYRDALSYEHEAIAIYNELGDRSGVGEVEYSIGSVYFYLGNYSEALKHYEKAFAVATETNDQRALGRVVSGMGSAYSSAGRIDLAEGLYKKCLEMARASKEETDIVWALNNLASLYIQRGERAAARRCLDEALGVIPREGQDYVRARTLYLLSMTGGSGASSIADLERALSLAEGSGIEELKWKCLSDLGELYLAEGDTAKSYSLQHRAILSVESLRRLAGSDELRRTFLQPAILPYERIVSLILARSGRATDVKEAFSYTERCRAQILASLLREAMDRAGDRSGGRLLDREREMLSRLTFYQARLQDGTITPAERDGFLKKIEGLEMRFVNLSIQLEQGDKGYASVLYPKVEQPDELLSTLSSDERVLSYFLGERRSYVFSARNGELSVHELPSKTVIEQRVDCFLNILQQLADAPKGDSAGASAAMPRQVFDSASNELFDLLLGPVAKLLEDGERLVIIPDGLINRLPFALLERGGRYLVQDHDVSYAPSLRTLRYLRERSGIRMRSKRAPEYGIIAIGASGESASGSKAGGRVYPFTDIPIEPLVHAAEEARSVAAIFKRSLVLAGKGAGESAFKGSPLDDAGIIHIAAHAYIDNDDLRRSFIVLNPDQGFQDTLVNPAEDGLLQWQEISALKLNTALVTLSACRSAGGVLSYGEGISGLTQAFLYAGGGCVVAAQLDLSDELTGAMMIEYYRNVAKGLGAAAALSAAQRAVLAAGGALANPAVWGAFVAIGDGSSAPKLSRGVPRLAFIAVALAAVALAALALNMLRRRR